MLSYSPPSFPKGVRTLLVATVAVYVVQIIPTIGDIVLDLGSLIPFRVFAGAQVWRLVTYLFLHDPRGPWHLVFNMLALWMFGIEIENLWGTRTFVLFYLGSGIGAGLLSFVMWHNPIIGASGAVLALLTVYAFYFPQRRVLMFFIFPMPVWLAVAIIGFISLAGSMSGPGGIAHLTHLGGILAAVIYVKLFPLLARAGGEHRRRRSEQRMRHQAEERGSQQRFFEDHVDPILKKISEQGMGSLSAEERKILRAASRRGRDGGDASKIIPFDFRQDK